MHIFSVGIIYKIHLSSTYGFVCLICKDLYRLWYQYFTFQKAPQALHFNNSFIFKKKKPFTLRYYIFTFIIWHCDGFFPICLGSSSSILSPWHSLLPSFTQRHPELCAQREKPGGEDNLDVGDGFSCCQLIPDYLWIQKKATGEMESF